MNSKTSYFSFSGALFKENLRRFWVGPAITILTGLLGLILPITLSYENGCYVGVTSYIDAAFNNYNPICWIIYFAAPLCAGIYVFQYLQKSASTTSMHAMPFSRSKLYFTNLVSGIVMSLIPLIVIATILLAICKPAYYNYAFNDGQLIDAAANAFTRVRVLEWFADSAIIAIFVYACTVLAGVVAGSPVMQGLLSVVFNFIAYAVAFPVVYFANEYIFGYEMDLAFLAKLNPMIYDFSKNSTIGTKMAVAYIVVSLAILVLARVLYGLRKNERTGDAITFDFMISILGILATICGLILGGLYFGIVGNGAGFIFVGYFVGAVLTFIITRMVLTKTVKIFNQRSLKEFGICILITALFIVGFWTDILGVGRFVPSASNVECVSISAMTNELSDGYGRYEIEYFNIPDSEVLGYRWGRTCFTDKENIEVICELHRLAINGRNDICVSNKDYWDREGELDESYTPLDITYKLNNRLVSRTYYVSSKWLDSTGVMATLYNSNEFKQNFALDNLVYDEIEHINVYNSLSCEEKEFTKDEAKELLAAMNADFLARDYETEISIEDQTFVSLNIQYWTKDSVEKYVEAGKNYNGISITLRNSDKNTLDFLKNHGCANITNTENVKMFAADFYNGEYIGSTKNPEIISYVLEHAKANINDRYSWEDYYLVNLFNSEGLSEYTIGQLDHLYEIGKVSDDTYNLEMNKAEAITAQVYVAKKDFPSEYFQQII